MKKPFKIYCIVGIALVLFLVISLIFLILSGLLRTEQSKYKSDMKDLKAEKFDRYYYFPDEVPEGATEVEWTKQPSILQGSGFETLGFCTTRSYIDNIISLYGENARIYLKYDYYGGTDYEWTAFFQDPEYVPDPPGTYVEHPFDVNSADAKRMKHLTDLSLLNASEFEEGSYHTESLESFPGSRELMEEHADDTVVYILYDNDNWNHQRINGFAVVPSENYIFFFCE